MGHLERPPVPSKCKDLKLLTQTAVTQFHLHSKLIPTRSVSASKNLSKHGCTFLSVTLRLEWQCTHTMMLRAPNLKTWFRQISVAPRTDAATCPVQSFLDLPPLTKSTFCNKPAQNTDSHSLKRSSRSLIPWADQTKDF